MRMLSEPGRIDHGSVLLGGHDLLAEPETTMRRMRGTDVAMVFQDPQAALNPVMKVGDQIAEALRVHGANRSEARNRALELLMQVGIPDVGRTIDQYPHEFSGGMRQRVVIAIALANKPRLLIADEPTTALDVTIQAQILRLLVQLRDDLGIAILMITHDMGVVAELCDDMIVMYGGRVVEAGPVAKVFQEPTHPYTTALLRAVPRADRDNGVLSAIPGAPPNPADLPPGCAFHPRCPLTVARCRTDTPPLLEIRPEQHSACWVSQAGDHVSVLPAGAPRTRPGVDHDAVPVLAVEHLSTNVNTHRALLRRTTPVYAVNDVSLHVRAGETLGLVGESGCGKSTLSRTIVGINRAASGRILIDGHDVTAMGGAERRLVTGAVQYVFQDPYASLNPRRTVGQALEEALEVAGVTGPAARARSHELLQRVGLDRHVLERYPRMFSGGQRQRLGIARALAAGPKLLICDEPVSALDVSIQAQIINLLEDLRDDLGLGYLFIAHDLSVVRHISDRVAVMYLGRIVESGTPNQVYGDPQHPYTVSLLSSTPSRPWPSAPASGSSCGATCPARPGRRAAARSGLDARSARCSGRAGRSARRPPHRSRSPRRAGRPPATFPVNSSGKDDHDRSLDLRR